MNPHIRRLYLAALLDGFALLALVLIAVPLKYFAGYPVLVKILGPTHGVLFIWLTISMVVALFKGGLSLRMGLLMFFSALVPFGAFFADRQLHRHYGHA